MDSGYAALYPELYRSHWWWRAREAILLRAIAEILEQRSTTPLRILDVGCGTGLFFDALAQFGSVFGLESDESVLQRSGRWREHIRIGDLATAYGRDERPFDLILMLDVIEHSQNPSQLLASAAGRLADEGRVLVTVPAFQWLWTNHDRINHHFHRYSASDLNRVLSTAGLTVEKSGYLFQSLVVPKLVLRAMETLRPQEVALPKTPQAPLNSFLKRWFAVEHSIAGWLPFGTSVLAVAHGTRQNSNRGEKCA